jgi:hypothetical protein
MAKGLAHDPVTVGRFWALINKGVSVNQARIQTGVGRTWAYSQVRGLEGGVTIAKAHRDHDKKKPPPRLDELSDIAKDCLDDFGRFRARYLGSISVPWQEECAQRIVELLESPDDAYAVVNCPQGGGKTRFFSHDLPVWITCRDRAVRGILGSLGLGLSHALVGNLRDTFGRTVRVEPRKQWVDAGLALNAQACLADDYGRFKPLRSEGGSWSSDKLTVVQLPDDNDEVHPSSEKEPTWAGFSYEARFLGWRVDFMVWDDLVNTQMLRNPDQVQNLYRWWDDEAESRLDPGGLCLLVGQRLRSNDIYRYALDKASLVDEIDADRPDTPKMYQHFVYKAHYDELCEGNHAKDTPAWPDGCLLDPKRVTWQKIRAKQVAGNFRVVFQQEDNDPDSVLVRPDWVTECWDTDRVIGQLPPIPPDASYIRFMTVDPSPTKWWGIIDTLYVLPSDTETLAGYRYVMNLARKRMGANEFLDWSRDQNAYIGLAEDWVAASKTQGVPITAMVMERNAAQRWAMQYEFFRTWSQTRGVQVLQHDTTNNKSDAELGVWATLPNSWRNGRRRLPGGDMTSRLGVQPLVAEVTTYPDGATDDLVMSEWFGEYNLGDLIGQVNSRTNHLPFYSDYPTGMFGGRPLTRGERRVADMIGQAS